MVNQGLKNNRQVINLEDKNKKDKNSEPKNKTDEETVKSQIVDSFAIHCDS